MVLRFLSDATNAFPSMSWDAVDKATGLQADRDDGVLLWTLFHGAACVINDIDGCSVVFGARQGGRQGDGPAAQRFTLAYDPTLVSLCLQTMDDDDLNVASRRDPWSEPWRPPMHVQMADDTAHTVRARTPELLVQRVWKLVATLGEAGAPLRIGQNRCKLQVSCCLQPCSAALQLLLRVVKGANLGKNSAGYVVHLGSTHECYGGSKVEISRAKARCNAAWCAWYGVWQDESVCWTWKCRLFQAVVQQAAIRGLQVVDMRLLDIHDIEACICKTLRSILKGRGYARSNCWVQKACRTVSASSLLMQRRLAIFRSILRLPGRLDQPECDLPASMFGDVHGSNTLQMRSDGAPLPSANPWLRLY